MRSSFTHGETEAQQGSGLGWDAVTLTRSRRLTALRAVSISGSECPELPVARGPSAHTPRGRKPTFQRASFTR